MAQWRVVALGPGTGLELWESLLRRRAWTQPLVVDIEGRDYALVVADGGADVPGSWRWLESLGRAWDPVLARAGHPIGKPRDLPSCRSEGLETLMTLERRISGMPSAPSNPPTGAAACATVEQAWAQVRIDRAVHAVAAERLPGPIDALREHDRKHGIDYVLTLKAWLDHPGTPSDAARSLHVHPNTLRYRIQRITELNPLDLGDADVRFAVARAAARATAIPAGPSGRA